MPLAHTPAYCCVCRCLLCLDGGASSSYLNFASDALTQCFSNINCIFYYCQRGVWITFANNNNTRQNGSSRRRKSLGGRKSVIGATHRAQRHAIEVHKHLLVCVCVCARGVAVCVCVCVVILVSTWSLNICRSWVCGNIKRADCRCRCSCSWPPTHSFFAFCLGFSFQFY